MDRKIAVLIVIILHSYFTFGQCSPDTTSPSITCPSDVTIFCINDLPSLAPVTSDFCGPIVLQTYSLTGATIASSPASGINDASIENFLSGTTTVTYYIEDAAGNSATCNFTVTNNDNIDPFILCTGDVVRVNDPGACTATVNMYSFGIFPSAAVVDGCSGLFLEPTGIPPGGVFPVGTTTVTWTATDSAGNSVSCSQDVIISDEEFPTIICPSDITVNVDPGQCSATVNVPLAVAQDNCSISSITNDYNFNGANASDTYPVGTTTVAFTATDSANQATTCTFNVTVVNTQAPVLTLNGNSPITIETCNTYTELGATAVDNCFGDISSNIVIDDSALDLGVVGSYDIIYSVTNANGVTTQIIRTVNVVDTTPPSLTFVGPNPLTIGDCSTYVELGATALDPCFGDISGSVVIDNSNVDTTSLGSYTVTYNVMDASGNPASQIVRTVNVVDINGPVISLTGANPQIIEACDIYTDLGATAIDPCFGTDYTVDILNDSSTLNTSVPGNYTVTYNVMDSNGNAGLEVIRNVTVVDTTGPIITLLSDNPQIVEACSPYVELGATALDPCLGTDYTSNIVIDASTVDTNTVGNYNVTYNVLDSEGNQANEVIRIIQVVDTTSPTINCPTDIIVNNDAGLCSAVVTYSVTSVDNCPGEILIQTDTTGLTSGDAFPIGVTTLEYTVTDVNGNSATCSFTITVNDVEAPVAICQNYSMQLDLITGLATLLPSNIDNGSSDNCSINLSISQDTFTCANIGLNTVTLTITDDSGNSDSCDAIVTITDAADNADVSISTPITTICQSQEITITASPVNGGSTPTYQWEINGVEVIGETQATLTTDILNDGDIVTVIMTSSASVCALPITSNSIIISVNDYNPPADAGTNIINTICTDTTVSLNGSAVNGINAIGTWTVTSGQVSGFSFSDSNSPTSDFTGDIGETYTLSWSIDNPEPCVDTSDSIIVTFIGCNALDFDGVDDNITFRDNYNLGTAFTVEVWVKSDSQNSNIQTILSKRETNNLINGYDLRIINNVVSFNWNNGQTLSSGSIQITNNRWYHLAVTYNGIDYTLYIDGIFIDSVTDNNKPIDNAVDCIAGAMDQTSIAPFFPENYFDGGLDELRIWDVALTEFQIRKMMNQEITDINPETLVNDGGVYGREVPLPIAGLSWSDLNGYYRMNQNTDLSSGNLVSNGNSGVPGVLRYMTTLQPETAPLPYQSISAGNWMNASTWLHGNTQALPNSLGVDGVTKVDWNIVRTAHDISSGDHNVTVLGLSLTDNELRIENSNPLDGQFLRVTDYLLIDGNNTVLKLVGESQLLQDSGSIVDYNGSGKLHRDQQGTSNLFNYNYWGSPVSEDGISYSLENVLYDGLQPVLWTIAHDANPNTTPITISSRWLYLYENFPINSYADWQAINEDDTIDVSLGFLMKGSGSASPEQNYTFKGKPNNGTYNSPITANYEALVSNPYPSAIDAHEFINDNSASILGTIYFWEHYNTNNTHVIFDYQGGFAAYNLSGGNPAVSPPEISGLGTPLKIPERYIPVGQGFNVNGNASGGNVVFENDQRVFVKEAVTGVANNGSVFMRTQENQTEPNVKRIRLEFVSPLNQIRHLMLAFVPNNLASDGFDYGYDAPNTENLPNDMSWVIDNELYIIQGVGNFDETKQYPLHVELSNSGLVEIKLNTLENFEENINLYIYDSLQGTYTLFNADFSYSINLDAGTYSNRFYLVFRPEGILSVNEFDINNVVLNYLSRTNEIYINTPSNQTITHVSLVNMLGQTVQKWPMQNETGELRLPVNKIAEGNYIIKLKTETNTLSKKVVISY